MPIQREVSDGALQGARVPWRQGDAAVSPVIGMVLVLGISLVGVAGILYWGMPAIDEMKANVEFRTMQGQMVEFDATTKELVAGTTEMTAKRWQPSLGRGTLVVQDDIEGWLYAVETYNQSADFDFQYLNLADGDHIFTIRNDAAVVEHVKVEAYVVSGTSSLTLLNVTGGAATAPRQMTAADLAAWPAGTPLDFQVYVKDAGTATPKPLQGATFKLRIYSGSSLVAEAWYMQTGHVKYDLESNIGHKNIVQNNGAILIGSEGRYVVANAPPIPPPSTTASVPRMFARSVVLQGDAAFGGEDTFSLLVALRSTATLGSYDCANVTARSDCIEAAKLFIYGDHRQAWHDYFTGSNGYSFVEEAVPTSSVTYLVDRRPHMGFTLLQSTLEVS